MEIYWFGRLILIPGGRLISYLGERGEVSAAMEKFRHFSYQFIESNLM